MKKYKITLTEEQMAVTQDALEEFFRLRYRQAIDFADDIASQYTDLSPDNPDHERIFERYIDRRDAIMEVMKAVFAIAYGNAYLYETKPIRCAEAETIWDAIRTVRGLNHWEKAFQSGGEPIPEIEVIEDESDE